MQNRPLSTAEIEVIQRFLVKHHYLTYENFSTRPGYFGKNTEAALHDFKRDHGLQKKSMQDVIARMIEIENSMRHHDGTTRWLNPSTLNLSTSETKNENLVPISAFETSRPVLVIDAGHGVQNPQNGLDDHGAERRLNGRLVTEERVTREMAGLMAAELNKAGYDVIITRNAPKKVDGQDRPDLPLGSNNSMWDFRRIAGNQSTTSFLSLHFNIHAKKDSNGKIIDLPAANGPRIFYDRNDKLTFSGTHELREQIRLEGNLNSGPDIINEAATEPQRRALGIFRPLTSGLAKTVHAGMPKLLIEIGFATNPFDLKNMGGDDANSKNWRKKFAEELTSELIYYHDNARELKALNGISSPTITESNNKVSSPASRGMQDYEHEIKSGETITTLARRYNISDERILAANPNITNPDIIRSDEILIIPNHRSYEVKKGEGLVAIAKRFGIDVRELAERNGLKPNDGLQIGQSLAIPVATRDVGRGDGIIKLAKDYAKESGQSCPVGQSLDTKALVRITKTLNSLTTDALPATIGTIDLPRTLPCKPSPTSSPALRQ